MMNEFLINTLTAAELENSNYNTLMKRIQRG